ncbi:MAG TPA: cell division protein FtsQ/DivIB [Aquabacterium sp.]|nr:cell division protein FtsQ/DivIB [Aquabacterium sp.]
MQAAAVLNHHRATRETPQDVRWMNAAALALLGVAVCMLLAAGLAKLTRLPYFNLQRVQLEGDLLRNNLATVRANIVPRLQGGFFSVDLARSREVFEAVPWVRKAVVRRVWPNQLRVVLEEHRPAAYWHHEDREDELVNTFGEVFEANLGDVEDDHLPTLAAPANPDPGDAVRMLAMLHRLQPLLQALGEIDTLKLTERGSWSVELDSEAVLELGRGSEDEILARTQRFVDSLPALMREYPAPLSYADLRYPEGYAVRMRGLTTLVERNAKSKQPLSSTR